MTALEKSLEEQASDILREAGNPELCRVLLLEKPIALSRTKSISEEDEWKTKNIVNGLHMNSFGGVLRKRPDRDLYVPVDSEPPTVKHVGNPCPGCGGPRSKFTISPTSLCRSCFQKKAVANFEKKLTNLWEAQDAFDEKFSHVEQVMDLMHRRGSHADFSIELIDVISQLEIELGCPVIFWKKRGLDPAYVA